MKLSDAQMAALRALGDEPRTFRRYVPLRPEDRRSRFRGWARTNTLEALEARGLAEARLVYPRLAFEWRITEAGLALLRETP